MDEKRETAMHDAIRAYVRRALPESVVTVRHADLAALLADRDALARDLAAARGLLRSAKELGFVGLNQDIDAHIAATPEREPLRVTVDPAVPPGEVRFVQNGQIVGRVVDAEREPGAHASDCAVHNAPAYPPGPCDCGAEREPGAAYETANAPCGFCGGPMPCYCAPTFDVAQAQREDDEARNRVDLPHDGA
jgi:hypothetical protein